jgi:signal peptidase II
MTSGTRFLVAVTAIGAALDQVTKLWATKSLRPIGSTTVVDGYVDLEYSLNPGAAWSLLADLPAGGRRIFFVVATIGASILIVNLYRKASPENRPLRWALALLLAGAVGNLVDRVRQGQVIDFVVLHWKEDFRWATFNVADVWITFGLVLLVWDMIVRREEKKVAAPEADRSPRRRRRR